MIKRKMFYSIIQEGKVTGVKEQDGFEIRVDREIFNAYRNEYKDRVYIIDPQTGFAVSIYNYQNDEIAILTESEMIKRTQEKLIEDKERLEKWRAMKNRESYKLAVNVFKAYKKAEKLREKQKEAVHREKAEGSKNGKGESNGSF